MMTYKPSKQGQGDQSLVCDHGSFVDVCVRLQVSVCSGSQFVPSWLTSRQTDRQTDKYDQLI